VCECVVSPHKCTCIGLLGDPQLLWPAFTHIKAVELLPSLHAAAMTCSEGSELVTWLSQHQQLIFENGDLFDTRVEAAHIVYVATTGFDEATMARLATFLELHLREGAVAITLSLPLPSKAFQLAHEAPYRFSWGNATVCVMTRKPLK
jgi:hypothetical protein